MALRKRSPCVRPNAGDAEVRFGRRFPALLLVCAGAACAVAMIAAAIIAGAPIADAAPRRPPKVSQVVTGKAGLLIHEFLSERARAGGFSGSVLVSIKGKIVVCRGYGWADRSAQTPVTIHSTFEIGSISKQFTAAAILLLELQGKLRTTDSIARHLKGVPAALEPITIHHLATHTSGISETPDFAGVDLANRDAMVEHVLKARPTSAPGEKFVYGDIGYCLLAAIVETASGERFEEYVERALFTPAGMTASGFCRDLTLDATKCVRGYDDTGNDLGPCASTPFHWGLRGATGVISSPADLYRWESALLRHRIFPEEVVEKLFHPFKDDYAYGWKIGKSVRGTQQIFHGGATAGCEAHYRRLVGEEILIFITLNCRNHIETVLNRVEELALKN